MEDKEVQGEHKGKQEVLEEVINLKNLNPERIPQLRGRRRKGEPRRKGE